MTKVDHRINVPGYRLIRKIGEGGMSVVYLAFQESLKREVALKIMRPIVTDEGNVVRRFEQEAEIIAKLYHPNIVNIYEVGHVDEDVLFYSMPYLQHGDLTGVVYQNDDELKQLIAGICDGLAYAHTQGVVHRDIKPENILFDQFGNVQIADFGIALSTGNRRFTKDSKILGSIYYMSPEQAQSKHIDKRSDIYGLGAILYELLTGDPVFDEEDDLSIMMAHLSKPVPRLPTELSHWQFVLDTCLAKSPSQRFQNMEHLKRAVLSVNIKKQPKWNNKPIYLAVTAAVLTLAFIGYGVMNLGEQNLNEDSIKTNPTVVVKNTNKNSVTVSSNDEELIEKESDVLVVSDQELVNQLSDAQVRELLEQATRNIEKKQLTTPVDNNALDQILKLLKNIPDHQSGLNLLSDVMAGYYQLLHQAVLKNDLKLANKYADSVEEVRKRTVNIDEALLNQLEQDTDLQKSLLIAAVVEKVSAAKKALNQSKADKLISLVDRVILGDALVNDLIDSVSTMLKPGQILTDNQGVKTVVITPQYNSKKGLLNYGLAVTQSEVTYAQYDRFAQATDRKLQRCKSKLKANLIFSQRSYVKPGFKVTADMPVVCVTWHDANQYASWLSQKTGLNYRLPTAQEWQHIQKLSESSNNVCGSANLAGQELFRAKYEGLALHNCNDGSLRVASVNRYNKNKLGLSGIQGNVSEWLSGCEKVGKIKAIFNPDDLCDNNPVIGRSWLSGSDDHGSEQRIKFDQAWTHIGFRLIRDLRTE